MTPPTDTEQGYTVHICSVCDYSYADDYVDPIEGEATDAKDEPQKDDKKEDVVEDEGEKPDDDNGSSNTVTFGCSSVVGALMSVAGVLPIAALALRKKRE